MSKIKATSFVITGGEVEDRHIGRGAGSWEGFDSILWELSKFAPNNGCYDKIDFRITFADGETYEGRYDLKHWSVEAPSLRQHVLSFVGCYSTRFQPAWTVNQPAEKWEAMKRDFKARGYDEKFGKFLDTYEIEP